MLKALRDNLKYLSWILWIVIALFVLLVFVDFGTLAGGQGGAAAPAVRVGDREVTIEEFERQYRQLEGFYRQMQGDQFTPEMARQMGLPVQALNQVVGQQILLEEAERMGLGVTDAELRERILEEPVFRNEQGRFVGREQYERILRQNRLTVSGFEGEMREQILLEKLNNVLRAGIYVSDAEVERAYREQVERAKIRYVQLPRARFAEAAQVSQAELQSYFDARKEEYKLPEQREGAYLVVEPDKLRDQANVSDAQIREYYDANPAEFTRPEQVQARHILLRTADPASEAAVRARLEEVKKRIQGGADFGTVAAEVSEEPGAKERKGDLGWFGSGQMVPEFEQAAFAAKEGEVVGPVKTSFGYHLIQVTGRRPAGVTPFEEAKEQIRARLGFTRTQELAEAKAKELAAQIAKSKPKSAEDLAKIAQANPGVTSAATGRFSAQEPIAGLGYSPGLTTAAFALKEKGDVTEAVQVPRGWAVFWLGAIHEPRVPELKDVEPRVRAAVTAQKQQELALQRLRQVSTPGKTLDQIAAELGLQVEESPEFGAGAPIPGVGMNPELSEAAMALAPGKLGGPVADSQGALVFEVTDRKAWDPIQFAAAREQTRAGVQNEKLGQILNALVAERRREVGVQYDPRLLESFGITPEQLDPSLRS